MNVIDKYKKRLIVVVVIVCQLFSTSCSRRLYPEKSFKNVETPAESRKLKTFMEAGNGKKLDVGKTGPSDIIKTARKYIGVPHCMGGTSMKCIDCSGLLTAVFAQHGIKLPHSSEEQARYGEIISEINQLEKGDLVFFIRSYKTDHFITHAGICIGNNEFIHTSSKKGVTITSLNDSWWKEKFIFGTRVFE